MQYVRIWPFSELLTALWECLVLRHLRPSQVIREGLLLAVLGRSDRFYSGIRLNGRKRPKDDLRMILISPNTNVLVHMKRPGFTGGSIS